MIKNDFAFCSLAFADKKDQRYIQQLKRLIESIRSIYKDVDHFYWVNEYPEDSPTHAESLYGFKTHAIDYARHVKGYNKVIWLDTACILQKEVDHWFTMVEQHGIVAAKDDCKLINTISDKALKYYGNPDITDWHLVGGSVYVMDFENPVTNTIFNHWKKAEADGMFGTLEEACTEQINKHRNDESAMSMALYMNGKEPADCNEMRYNNRVDPIVIKKHFK